jgi:hypothetical protein
MRPATRERVLILALLGLAGVLYFQRGQVDQLKEAERQAVQSFRAARAQTDDAFRLVGAYRDSLARRGTRVDTVVRTLAGVADTIRLRASVPGDSVVIAKFEVLAWADKIDKAVNEVSQYRAQVDSLLAANEHLAITYAAERAITDSLLSLKDLRIKAERKQGRKEGIGIGAGLILVSWLILK